MIIVKFEYTQFLNTFKFKCACYHAPMTQKRNNPKASATRNAIIDAAERLLNEQGAAGLTLDAIASACGITVQTIYNRVGGRAALLLAITEKAMAENREYMDQAYRREGSPQERLLAVVEGYARFALERPDAFRLMSDPPDDPQALPAVTDMVRSHNQQLEGVIRAGIQAGVIDASLDPQQTATALWAAANGLLALNWRPDRDAMTGGDIQGVIDTAVRIVMAGLFRT